MSHKRKCIFDSLETKLVAIQYLDESETKKWQQGIEDVTVED